jgi:hypothetical protein
MAVMLCLHCALAGCALDRWGGYCRCLRNGIVAIAAVKVMVLMAVRKCARPKIVALLAGEAAAFADALAKRTWDSGAG